MNNASDVRLLFIFDKDSTLIKGAGLNGFRFRNALHPQEQMLKPNVFEKLAELRAAGHAIAIASNMSAVADGLITMEEAHTLMRNCAAKVGGVDAWRCCGYNPRARKTLHGQPNPYARDDPCKKPHPGMILELMQALGFPPERTVMVGNSKNDRKAAQAAGVQFFSAKAFFKRL